MRYVPLLALIVLLGCNGKKKYHPDPQEVSLDTTVYGGLLKFQKELNKTFRNPETSPLPDRYRKNFEGLAFFKPDTNYRVKARLVRTPDAIPFLMPTTTSRKTKEKVYGIVHFELNGNEYELELYQNSGEPTDAVDENYLFLPFLDATNGEETYAGGRYIDLSIPQGDTIVIDFNKAYNPYCVYNKKYSCPLVPRINALPIKVAAGVKMFVPN